MKSRRSSQTTRVDGPFLITRFWAKLRELLVSVLWFFMGSPLLLPDWVQGSYRAQEGPRGCGILQTLKKLLSALSECRPLPHPGSHMSSNPAWLVACTLQAHGQRAPWPSCSGTGVLPWCQCGTQHVELPEHWSPSSGRGQLPSTLEG